jgi:hypothetical protein
MIAVSAASDRGPTTLVSAAGKPMFNTFFTEAQRSPRREKRKATSMLALRRMTRPATSTKACKNSVAMAAPAMPSAGKPAHPKMSTGSRMALTAVEMLNSTVTVLLSPWELKANRTENSRNTSIEPEAMMVKYTSASGRMPPVAPEADSSGRRKSRLMAVNTAPAMAESTKDWPRMRSASMMSRRPMAMAISTPDPTVMPMLSEIITKRVSCEMLTAAIASGENLLTQKASTAL